MSHSKYQQLAQIIQTQIEQGLFKAGDALPSLRQFCQLHSVSMTTALSTYRELEAHGVIFAQEKRGYFVAAKPQTAPSYKQFEASVSPLQVRNRLAQTPQFGFATAQLDPDLMDADKLSVCIARAARRAPNLVFNYSNVAGNEGLREALCGHWAQQGFHQQANEVVITQGCLDAVLTALQVICEKGDTVAVSSPCYVGLLDALAVLGLKVFEIPSTSEGLDLEQLEGAMQSQKIQACLITANHQNPTGHSLNALQKQRLAELTEQYHIPLVEDDVFRELSHAQHIPLPIKHYDRSGWVLWCSSVSKTLAPGMRLGWCVPGRFYQAYLNFVAARSLGSNTPLQLALTDYLNRGYYRRHLNKVNTLLATQVQDYLTLIQAYLPKRCWPVAPSGGLVLWLDLHPLNTKDIQQALQQHGILVRTGDLFSSTLRYQHYMRLNAGLLLNEQNRHHLVTLLQLVADALKNTSTPVQSQR